MVTYNKLITKSKQNKTTKSPNSPPQTKPTKNNNKTPQTKPTCIVTMKETV